MFSDKGQYISVVAIRIWLGWEDMLQDEEHSHSNGFGLRVGSGEC